jgi:thiamine biosynthesis lipoprotein
MNAAPRTISRRQLFALDFRGRGPASSQWLRIHRTAMACRFEVLFSGEGASHMAAARRALDEVDRIEAALTVFRDTSALVRLNREASDGPVTVDQELYEILRLCRELSDRTDGAFDITSTPVSRCWGFLRREGRLPDRDEITRARATVGIDGVELDAAHSTVRFARPGIELNLGSIGKGYAVRRMAELLKQDGVDAALLSAGGSSVFALGGDAEGWQIDLNSRRVARGRVARLRLRNVALATSGAGEQFVDVKGTRYGHVLDPRTGWPASGILSASVVAPDPAAADALSTAFLVGGVALAERYCHTYPETLAILTPDDGAERPCVIGSCRGVALET